MRRVLLVRPAVAMAAIATMFLLVFSASALAGEPWWQVTTGSRPTNLWLPKNEVQEVKRQPGLTLVRLEGVMVACMGGPECTSEYSLPDDETAAELQGSLESGYGAGAVAVSEDPKVPGRFLVESVGSLAGRYVTSLTVFSSQNPNDDRDKVLVEGGSGRLAVSILDLGDTAVEAGKSHLRIVDALPEGLAAYHVQAAAGLDDRHGPVECVLQSASEIECSFDGTLPAFEAIELEIFVSPTGSGSPVAGTPGVVSVSGADTPPVVVSQPVRFSPEATQFGVESYSSGAEEEGGTPALQAGSHPFQFTTTVQLNQGAMHPGVIAFEEQPAQPRNLRFTLPAGLVGNAIGVARCDSLAFTNQTNFVNECSDETVIGAASVTFSSGNLGLQHVGVPVFNLQPVAGEPARFGFMAGGVPVTLDPTVQTADGYRITVSSNNTTQAIAFLASTVTFWGNPGDHRHDTSRGWNCVYGEPSGPCTRPPGLSESAFLRLPTTCVSPESFAAQVEPWNVPLGSTIINDSFASSALEGCNRVPFSPSVEASLTGKLAEAPSGLDFQLTLPNSGLLNAEGIAEAQPKKVEVVLPEGVTLNPAAGEGLATCSPAQFARETASSLPGEGCPEASKLGSVQASTPLLEEEAHGSLYVATPHDNPFDSLIAVYLVAKIPDRGVLIKQAGKVIPDPNTGRLTTTFDDLPPLPFENFKLQFREGARAPLATPPACGTYTTTVRFLPWSAANLESPSPSEYFTRENSFAIEHGTGGVPCPNGGIAPFKPGLVAGTQNNQAGAYTPLDIHITRNDGEQEITGFSSLLPAGVTANLTGVPFCTEAQIASANTKTGVQEQSEPSCPVASEIGHTLVGVGVGSVLAYTPGKLYMAGPYEGAPFSVVAITSAKVGPFDLGTVVVHLPLNIDPNTATVSIPAGAADQIPHIVKGIVVHVRDIRVYVDRANFTKNPTNCSPLSFGANVTGSGQNFVNPADDVTVGLSNPFEVANCANLAFKPDFKVSTAGKTSKANGASLNVRLAFPNTPAGTQANIRSVKVELPKQLPSRLTTLQKACTATQFHTNPAGCPAASVVGHAKVITPILPVPLEGPAYFVSNGSEAFPNLIMVLQGYGVTIDLVGSTFINKAGITSSTFKTVPDQPVTSFELTLPQGPFSALTANGNLCSLTKTVTIKKKVTLKVKGHKKTITRSIKQTKPASLTMPTEFVAQNGAIVHQTTAMSVTGCPKAKPAKKKKPAKKASKKKG